MSVEIGDRIRATIRANGPMTFAEFMECALYGPGGFYEDPPIGRNSHFVTSPHVHPVFGSLLAGGLRAMWSSQGRPDPFALTELGAGDGTLAEQILDGLGDLPVDYLAVERSPGARSRLSELPVRVAPDLEGSIGTGCVLANELLDNLPFRRVRGTATGVDEIRVGLSGERLVEVHVPADAGLLELCPHLRPSEDAAVPTGALDLVDNLSASMSRGYALLIDYGEATGRGAGAVHGYRSHRVMADVLEQPGSADITAGVDFSVLVGRARARGLDAYGPVSQRAALRALGFTTWAGEQRSRQVDLLDAGSGLDAVMTWGARSRATLLVDPAGLGRLRWLLLATTGLPRPEWYGDALIGARTHAGRDRT